jgi:6-phosphofructokinase
VERARPDAMSAAVVLHSGGPTPVINASLLGVVEEARRHRGITAFFGARHGIGGVLREDFADLFSIDVKTLAAIARAPSSALGTSRDEVREDDLDRAFAVLGKRAVRYLFYTGGNGSMGAASGIERHAKDRGYCAARSIRLEPEAASPTGGISSWPPTSVCVSARDACASGARRLPGRRPAR